MTLADLNQGIATASLNGKSTLIIKDDTFPTTEEQFKQYFTYDWEQNDTSKVNHICLGCMIHGNQTLNHLKHSIKLS